MSTAEMKLEAIKEIAKVNSEETLKEILAYLSAKADNPSAVINLSQHYHKVAEKYSAVMQKLAQ